MKKMPKTRWILALLGVVTLAGGYILALKADNVLTGLNTFLWQYFWSSSELLHCLRQEALHF